MHLFPDILRGRQYFPAKNAFRTMYNTVKHASHNQIKGFGAQKPFREKRRKRQSNFYHRGNNVFKNVPFTVLEQVSSTQKRENLKKSRKI